MSEDAFWPILLACDGEAMSSWEKARGLPGDGVVGWLESIESPV